MGPGMMGVQQVVLEEYLTAIDAGVERVVWLVAHMERVLMDWDRKPLVEALRDGPVFARRELCERRTPRAGH
jgi:hypothetical protein